MSDRKVVSLHDLSYRSVLPQLRADAPDRTEEFDLRGERVVVARVVDMLYLPDCGLQIFEGRRETLLDLSGLASIKLNRINDDQSAVYPLSDFKYRDDEVCVLSNSGSYVFYHWLEELYKVDPRASWFRRPLRRFGHAKLCDGVSGTSGHRA
jgi:hypothetical protein